MQYLRLHPLRPSLFLLVLGLGFVLGTAPAEGQSSITGQEVECSNGTAAGYPCKRVDLLSYLNLEDLGGTGNVKANDIWGWTDPQTGTEWALVGRTDGVAFVDVSTPTNPVYVGELPTHSRASTWRDMKVYDNHVFVVSEAAEHGMQVFDLTQLRSVGADERPVTFKETAHYNRIETAHNVAINPETGYAFIVGGGADDDTVRTCGGGLHMVNVQDPTAPTFAGCFPESSDGQNQSLSFQWGTLGNGSLQRRSATGRSDAGYTHDTQCVTYRGPDAEYQGKEVCFNANETVVNIANVTDKDAPTTIAEATYPKVGYVHQAWLTEDHRYLYVDDELDERNGLVDSTRTLVFDVTNLDDPTLVTRFSGTTGAIDHNQYLDGNYAYQANYTSGLRILDVAAPTRPAEVAFFDTYPASNAPSFKGAWSTYPFFERNIVLVSGIGEGLFVLEPNPPPILSLRGTRRQQRALVRWRISADATTDRMLVEHKSPEASSWTRAGTVAGRPDSGIQQYAFTLDGLSPGTHQVRIRHVSTGGTTHTSSVEVVRILPSTAYVAEGPFPNPVRDRATFKLTLRESQSLRVALYDALGRRVRVLHDDVVEAGRIQRFRIHAGRRASGTYFLRVQGESIGFTRTVVIAR
ncbi:MAG: choice-of-anchor B family protein [Salinibacter sp.]